ncbi:MAG TPA: TauD/TfdA family dioxygenase [Caulobacteraceae bacterium]|nr:TauD/TfdA family dioxygenase [Caulobacteraceae bacterium]
MSETFELARPETRLRLAPITPSLGADVTGLDLRRDLDAATVAAIRQALLQHKVLVFRDQAIDDARQIAFSRYFGRVTPAHPIKNGLSAAPEIMENVLTDDRDLYAGYDLDAEHPLRPALRPRARVGWHIDITFVANPTAITFLRGVEIPPVGGDTLFANLEALYESLSPSLKAWLDTLQAIHARDDAAVGRPPKPRFDGRQPGPFASLHPLVRVHPETGRKHLFLATGFVKAIHGLRPRESAALLDFLNAELEGRADLHARVRWNKGDLVVWDNRAVAHAGPIDPKFIQGERVVHRTTVEGDLPAGPDGFVSRSLHGELFNTIS